MVSQPPSPPSISPRQMTLVRVVASMAWSDGNLSTEEVELMLDRFSSLFSATAERQSALKQELREYLVQNIPLEELVPKLKSDEEQALVLRLGYEVISSSARTPEEPSINQEEAKAYQHLVKLLNLSDEAVNTIEAEAQSALENSDGLVDLMTHQLKDFFSR